MSTATKTRSVAVRERLKHPVVDGDGRPSAREFAGDVLARVRDVVRDPLPGEAVPAQARGQSVSGLENIRIGPPPRRLGHEVLFPHASGAAVDVPEAKRSADEAWRTIRPPAPPGTW